MNPHLLRTWLVVAVLVGGALLALPTLSRASSAQWVDQIAEVVVIQKNLDSKANWDPYLKQLEAVSEAASQEDFAAERKGMNRFLEMVETKEGGITGESAHKIFARVVNVTPYAVLLPLKHEEKLDPDEKALVERLKRFIDAIKEQNERAALSF